MSLATSRDMGVKLVTGDFLLNSATVGEPKTTDLRAEGIAVVVVVVILDGLGALKQLRQLLRPPIAVMLKLLVLLLLMLVLTAWGSLSTTEYKLL